MRQFSPNFYYVKTERDDIIQPKAAGVELIMEYLQDKYGAHITHPISSYTDAGSGWGPHVGTYVEFLVLSEFDEINKIFPYLFRARNQSEPYREGFIVYDTGHARFMAYVHEGGKEAILVSDSLGERSTFLKNLAEQTGLPVYANLGPRQSDATSCITDSIVFARDITRRNLETQEYYIPDLIEKLQQQATPKNGWYATKLPAKLLKTAQKTTFIQEQLKGTNRGDETQIIHKQKSLAFFHPLGHPYLKTKAIKYTSIIQIQFYIYQLEEELGFPLNPAQKKAFTQDAKARIATEQASLALSDEGLAFRTPPVLHELAEQRLKDLSINSSILTLAVGVLKNDATALSYADKHPKSEHIIDILVTEVKKRGHNNEQYYFKENPTLIALILLITKDEGKFKIIDDLLHHLPDMPSKSIVFFMAELAINDKTIADYLIQKKTFMTDLVAFRQELLEFKQTNHKFSDIRVNSWIYLFASSDAYLAEQILQLHVDLLMKSEKEALEWVAWHNKGQSKLVGYCTIAEKILEKFHERFDRVDIELLKKIAQGEKNTNTFSFHQFLDSKVASLLTLEEKEQVGWMEIYHKPDIKPETQTIQIAYE